MSAGPGPDAMDRLYRDYGDALREWECDCRRPIKRGTVLATREVDPPEDALIGCLDGWHPYNFGGKAEEIDVPHDVAAVRAWRVEVYND